MNLAVVCGAICTQFHHPSVAFWLSRFLFWSHASRRYDYRSPESAIGMMAGKVNGRIKTVNRLLENLSASTLNAEPDFAKNLAFQIRKLSYQGCE
jgi:hypothetical protein